MFNSYYKGYWMVTNRCNLNCSYCVLENAPYQLKAELNLNAKKELIFHLYNKLNFRRLTLSGGEVLIIGKHPPNDFIELLRYISSFRSPDPVKNLEIELYTNGTYLDERVVNEMRGIIDTVAITIDSTQDDFLSQLGRNHKKFNEYFQSVVRACSLLHKNDIELKLHSVVNRRNHLFFAEEVSSILDSVERAGGKISYWKFYQYMSYNVPEKDEAHAISTDLYETFKKRTKEVLKNKEIRLHFKDNKEMNASLFNILSYGNAQYMRPGDTWLTSQRTKDLRTYNSMPELFENNNIDEKLFRHFHEVYR